MSDHKAAPTPQPRGFEAPHALLSRRVAAEGMVLLENSGVLPLSPCRVALFGNGARRTIKGGTGSGDVNERSRVTVEDGLRNAGFVVTGEAWRDRYDSVFRQRLETCREAYSHEIYLDYVPTLIEYIGENFRLPTDVPVTESDLDDSSVAIYVLARRSGEGRDRTNTPGDFLLSESERDSLALLASHYSHVIVVLNTGGVIDTAFWREISALNKNGALLLMSQAGMCAGDALCDVLIGRITPCGHLTDTWALRYEDYPASFRYVHSEKKEDAVVYGDGVYVGYRYFDAFQVACAYPFGYGLSYTSFSLTYAGIAVLGETVSVSIRVTNTGKYVGRAVAQLYLRSPASEPAQPYRQLAAFEKTELLNPGQSAVVQPRFLLRDHSRYLEQEAVYALYAGTYMLYLGQDLSSAVPCAAVRLNRTVSIRSVKKRLSPKAPVHELAAQTDTVLPVVPTIEFPADAMEQQTVSYTEPVPAFVQEAQALSDAQLYTLVTGCTASGLRRTTADCAQSIPGAGGETTSLVPGVPNIVLADGPAGIRIQQHFVIDDQGNLLPDEPLEHLEGGIFAQPQAPRADVTHYYQYCTAFPIGTLLAQTWDVELAAEIGKAISEEMRAFGIGVWLAPGMNLHRDPLCGLNFEYYSEDPLLTAKIAGSVVEGVQRCGCTGATVKHFACNNRETRRMASDSIVSERALRELYLRSFELVLRDAKPYAVMSSYNLLNGTHTANNRELCTDIARCEWGYDGLIMSDWGTTNGGNCTADGCIRAGNDLVMPGTPKDIEEIRCALENGTLPRARLCTSAARVLALVRKVSAQDDLP